MKVMHINNTYRGTTLVTLCSVEMQIGKSLRADYSTWHVLDADITKEPAAAWKHAFSPGREVLRDDDWVWCPKCVALYPLALLKEEEL